MGELRPGGSPKRQPPDCILTTALTAAGIIVPVAFRAGGSGIIDRMTIGTGGAMMIKATAPPARFGMVKVCIPVAGGMTLGAGTVELPDMGSWLGVAGSTGGRSACEDIIHVAPGTSQANMGASQWKGGRRAQFIMRKMGRIDEGHGGIRPAVIRVTAPARTVHSALDQ
jgi:hypothetical protein